MDYKVIQGDCLSSLKKMQDQSVDCCITSPPYWQLRDYGVEGQLGMESTPKEFVDTLVEIFEEVKRVLKDDGTLWLNLGDSYVGGGRGQDYCKPDAVQQKYIDAGVKYCKPTGKIKGLKPKDLVGIPFRVALALQDSGWWLRQDIIWHKPNPMPESVTDRCTKSHEYLFLLSKSQKYYYDNEAIKEEAVYQNKKVRSPQGWDISVGQGGHGSYHKEGRSKEFKEFTQKTMRNKRSVWTIPNKRYKGSHFATFPTKLVEPCVLAGCREGGTVLDIFGGSGTVAEVALQHNRNAILCELNPEYVDLIHERMKNVQPKLI